MNIFAWGLEVIKTFQSVQSPALTLVVKLAAFLGDPAAYALVLPIFFWCFDEKKGFRLILLCLGSAACNTIIKQRLAVPRPFVADPSVGLIHETGFSTPSGHAQGSAVFWASAVFLICGGDTKRRTAKICLALIPPFLIGLSRVYLGVHYPTDVFFGWLLGGAIAVGGFFVIPLAEKYITPLARSFKILILSLAAFCLNALNMADTSLSAVIFGLATGYVLLCDTGGFSGASGTAAQKIQRALLGFAGLALLYAGLKMVFPAEGTAQYNLFRFIRYAAMGFWAGFAVPKLSVVLKLASAAQSGRKTA